MELKDSVKHDLARWLGLHCRDASKALAEMPDILACQIGRDGGSLAFINRSEMVASSLEEAAAKMRRDIARAHALNETTQ